MSSVYSVVPCERQALQRVLSIADYDGYGPFVNRVLYHPRGLYVRLHRPVIAGVARRRRFAYVTKGLVSRGTPTVLEHGPSSNRQ